MGEDSAGGDLRRRCHSYTGSSNGSVFCQSGYMGRIEIFFWKIHTSAFQEWYLGDDNYIRYLHKAPYSGGKPGFLDRETPLAPPSGIKNMFERLKESGYELGVATGRARIEMEVPFKTYGWYEEFESNYLATASDAVDESKMYGGSVPDKPHPFIYLCAAYGRNKEIILHIWQEQLRAAAKMRFMSAGIPSRTCWEAELQASGS